MINLLKAHKDKVYHFFCCYTAMLTFTAIAIIKCMEGGLDIEAEYPGLIAQRNEWRRQVNAMRSYL